MTWFIFIRSGTVPYFGRRYSFFFFPIRIFLALWKRVYNVGEKTGESRVRGRELVAKRDEVRAGKRRIEMD